jgi:hypothetical protein
MGTVRVYGGKPPVAAGARSPLLSGLLTGIVLAVAWILLVYLVHNPVSVLSWGIGALLGVVVAKAAQPPTRQTGTLAALLTLGTVLFAKAGIVVAALQPIVRDELVRNRDAIAGLYLIEMTQQRSFSPELQSVIDARKLDARPLSSRSLTDIEDAQDLRDFEMGMRIMEEARGRADSATRDERVRLVRKYTDRLVETMGFGVLFLGMFGVLDLLWLGLGVSTAWKLGQGIG